MLTVQTGWKYQDQEIKKGIKQMKRLKNTRKFKNTNIQVEDALSTPDYASYNEDTRELHIRIRHQENDESEPYDEEIKRVKKEDLPEYLQDDLEKLFDDIVTYLQDTDFQGSQVV